MLNIMVKKLHILLVVAGFWSANLFSQSVVGIGPNGVSGFPDQIEVGDEVNFSVEIQNKGVTQIDSGIIKVFLGTQHDNSSVVLLDSASIVASSANIIGSGDTRMSQISFNIDTTNADMIIGGNTVVVWPALDGAMTLDSLFVPYSIIPTKVDLGFDFSSNISFPDSVLFNTVDSIVFFIENKDTLPFIGNILLSHQIISDSLPGIHSDIDSTSLSGVSLLPMEKKRVAMPQNFTNPGYRIGGNTVVVWPIGDNITTVDTITGRVTVVEELTSIDTKWPEEKDIKLYPNPSSHTITITFPHKLSLKDIKVYNTLGMKILETKSNRFDISSFSNGFYFISASFDDNKSKVFKVIKEN